jgi:hypothetical protein
MDRFFPFEPARKLDARPAGGRPACECGPMTDAEAWRVEGPERGKPDLAAAPVSYGELTRHRSAAIAKLRAKIVR